MLPPVTFVMARRYRCMFKSSSAAHSFEQLNVVLLTSFKDFFFLNKKSTHRTSTLIH